ncbi:MAG TPA: lysoplasmalogenase [Ruania sp.]|nr:lysoplasmalogenase [Ruania sp.]
MGARSWRVALGLVAAVHLLAQLLGAHTLASGTQVLLVPALAGWVWSAGVLPPRAGSTRAYAAALLLSWVGDSLPRLLDGDASFVAMVTSFLLAQVSLVTAYLLLVRRWPSLPVMVAYLVAFGVLYFLCAPTTGDLLVLVAAYGLLLVIAGALSSTVSLVTGIGGALFVLSDAMIALQRFLPAYQVPQHDFLVMLTYIAAQVLIAYGLLRHHRARPTGTSRRTVRATE